MANNTLLFNTDRAELRERYFHAFSKFQNGENLAPLEKKIVTLIQEHPEYHAFFANPNQSRDAVFSAEQDEVNPFLHLGLHLSLQEQVTTNRPKGITAIYRDLVQNFGDTHHAEHHMMEILANSLWQEMNEKSFFDEKNYIKQLKKLLKKGCAHHH